MTFIRLVAAAAALLGIVALGLVLDTPRVVESSEWTQYRSAATNNAEVTSGLTEIRTGAIATANEVRSTPVIAAGKMFVGNHDSGELQAFDLVTGALVWQQKAPNWVHSEMIYQDGRIYVGFGNRLEPEWEPGDNRVRGLGESGLLSLDAATGKPLWRYDTEGAVMPTPALVGGSLYAVTGDKHLYELDPDTGEERRVESLPNWVSMSSPAAADGVLYFGGGSTTPSRVYAYDTEAKDFAWRTELPAATAGLDDVPPAVADGLVVTTLMHAVRDDADEIVGETHELLALDAVTGEVVWRHDLGSGPVSSNNRSGAPMIDEGTVFVGSPTTKESYAYDLQSGEQLWHAPTGAVKGAPATNGRSVYFGTVKGAVFALDPRTGEIQGRVELDGVLAPAGPVIVDGTTLVVASQNATVYILPIGGDGGFAGAEDGTAPGS
ncbi:PQQ-binding-like beta-propeller repeat protein [uncultured Arthrobacter sp.]|uniref:outer membrane protein assembly factor BamB family protein n=1 Tax=uncultured Arthrobacter sp. TaxID=114050 RepID=UPI00262C054D|nr:PQQ-binding-like beta-propeller repeat protein [uncultured Arthrobacter sp.]